MGLFAPRPSSDDPAAIYVRTLCFVFCGSDVLLIQRPRDPDAGYWNAIGGRINRGEDPLEGAQREVWEEAGIRPELAFRGVATVIVRATGETWTIFLFSGRVTDRAVVASPEGPLRWVAPDEIGTLPVLADVPYLLPHMAAGDGTILAKFTYAAPDPRTLEASSTRIAVYR